jgi:hypothetical protein
MTAPLTTTFGFNPQESQHHFRVRIPATKKAWVSISEHLEWDQSDGLRELNLALGREDQKARVLLPYPKWAAIADAARDEFNRRLRQRGLRPARWRHGDNLLERLIGKELVLLAWAIEDADPALIPVAIQNWIGLAPEERWWLYTMTNAATGNAITGRNRGWRKAVRYALTENPLAAPVGPPPRLATPMFADADADEAIEHALRERAVGYAVEQHLAAD